MVTFVMMLAHKDRSINVKPETRNEGLKNDVKATILDQKSNNRRKFQEN